MYYVTIGVMNMDMFQEILSSGFEIPVDEAFHPECILSGSGFGWFYSETKRTMVRVIRGSECLIFDKDPTNDSKVIVQIGNEVLSIPESELLEVGWN